MTAKRKFFRTLAPLAASIFGFLVSIEMGNDRPPEKMFDSLAAFVYSILPAASMVLCFTFLTVANFQFWEWKQEEQNSKQ